jgi:hypothetical protein
LAVASAQSGGDAESVVGKRRYSWDEAKIARFEKEGRGLGTKADYKPWLTIHDVPSTGRRSRAFSHKTGRLHHLLSDIESSLFFLANWNPLVVDIREQFPLDRKRTRELAAHLGIQHPQDATTACDVVMTLDLLIDQEKEGRVTPFPVSAKPADKLDDRRTLEKLEIERVYCQERWGGWSLMTERDYSPVVITNLRWAHEMADLEKLEASHPSFWSDAARNVLHLLRTSRGGTLEGAFRALESKQGLPKAHALTAFRHLVATKAIGFDLTREFSDSMPISTLAFSDPVAVRAA